MKSGIVAALVGGTIPLGLISYFSTRIRNSVPDGTLRFGWGIALLGLACAGIVALAAGAFFYDNDIGEDHAELLAVIALIAGFGLATIYCWGEYLLVRGAYDDRGIEFHTPWTGRKTEEWRDLESVRFNAQMSWHVLKFKSGKVIRLSSFLSGHGGVLDKIGRMAGVSR